MGRSAPPSAAMPDSPSAVGAIVSGSLERIEHGFPALGDRARAALVSVRLVSSLSSSRVVIDGEVRPARVRFADGVITAIDSGRGDADFGDLIVMPGLVDTHVHVNDPGRADWEGFDTATRAAAAGGTTTIVDMPLNSIPPTVSVAALDQKRQAAAGRLAVDVAFWGGLVPGALDAIRPLVAAGVCGFKSFLVDSGVLEFPPVPDDVLVEGLAEMAALGVPALIHAEDPGHLAAPEGDGSRYATYLRSRPVESEVRAILHVSRLAAQSSATAHILHVSSGDGAAAISAAGGVTGETCPHYLTFAAEEIPDGATAFKCAPPIRGREHREGLWDALSAGRLAMVVSDHSPAPPQLKAVDTGDFVAAWGGISSLQLRLPAVWDGASRRGVGLVALSEWLSSAPARLAGLGDRKGSITVGADADFVVWDPQAVTAVEGASLEHRHALTPYEGMALRGRIVATFLGGREVFSGGTVAGFRGRMLRRG